MKIIKIVPVVFLIMVIVVYSSCSKAITKERNQVISEQAVVWLGIDYSLVRFSYITEDPQTLIGSLQDINNVVTNEVKKYDIKKYFKKSSVAYDLSIVSQNNSRIDAGKLIINSSYTITKDEVKKLVSTYNTNGRTGMGLVFIAENMSKASAVGSFYVCFIDLSTKEIIDSAKIEGKASGFGFRNYWARPVFEVMRSWSKL